MSQAISTREDHYIVIRHHKYWLKNVLCVHVDDVAVNDEVAIDDLDFAVVLSVGGIVLEEVSLNQA